MTQLDTFDNSKPNVILLTDVTGGAIWARNVGPYKVAHELRLAGFEVAVINFLHIYTVDEIKALLNVLISKSTLFVGVHNAFYEDMTTHKVLGLMTNLPTGLFLPHGVVSSKEMVKYIRDSWPSVKLAIGGPYAFDSSLNSYFDFIVVGYADTSIVNLANHLLRGEQLNFASKSVFGPVVIRDSKAPSHDFANSRVQYKSYDCISKDDTLVLEIARGCIFNCDFCSYPLNGKKKLDFVRNADLIRADLIENYERWGVTKYLISDDTFNDNPDKVKLIHSVIMSLPFKIEFWCYIRIDLLHAHPQNFDLLVEAGLRSCWCGIETLNKQAGIAIGKGMNKDKQLQIIQQIKAKHGNRVSLHGAFIVGLPHESAESNENTAELIITRELPVDTWSFTALHIDKADSGMDFISSLARNPEKYGYKVFQSNDSIYLDWSNPHTTMNESVQLASKLSQDTVKFQRGISGIQAFMMSGAGHDIDELMNTPLDGYDWDAAVAKKQQVAVRFKKAIFAAFGVPELMDK